MVIDVLWRVFLDFDGKCRYLFSVILSVCAFSSACCYQGAGTKDDTLIRVVVTRSEVDMVQVKQEFQRQFGTTLDAMIEVGSFS